MRHHFIALSLCAAILSLSACDQAETLSLREKLEVELDEVGISLTEAIEAAAAEVPEAVVIEADLEIEHEVPVYRVELYAEGTEYDVDVSTEDGSILRSREDAVDGDDQLELQAAADLVVASPGWGDIIATAEAEVGATAFEVEADGDDGVLEVEALSDAGIHELELGTDGSVLKSEMSDDDEWEHDEEVEDEDEHGEGHGDEHEDEVEHD